VSRCATRKFCAIRAIQLDLRAGECARRIGRIRLQNQPFRSRAAARECRRGRNPGTKFRKQTLGPNDTVVEFEAQHRHSLQKLRQALGDDAASQKLPRYIETLTIIGGDPLDGAVEWRRWTAVLRIGVERVSRLASASTDSISDQCTEKSSRVQLGCEEGRKLDISTAAQSSQLATASGRPRAVFPLVNPMEVRKRNI